MNTTVEQIKKAFRESRKDGEELLQAGRITWDQYAFVMRGFEAALRSEGVEI